MTGGNGSNLMNLRVPLPTVIAWVVGIAGFLGGAIAMLAWGWLVARVGNLENGTTTPMAQTTRIRFEQIDRDLRRLESEIARCLRDSDKSDG